MGYLMVLHVRLGAKIGDLHAKDFNAFCKRQIRNKVGPVEGSNLTTFD